MALTAAQTDKLEALRYYGTNYELVIANGTDTRLLAYCGAKGRRNVMQMIRLYAQRLVDFTGAEEFTTGKRVSDPITIGAYKIKFSGRTQREAIGNGELPRIP